MGRIRDAWAVLTGSWGWRGGVRPSTGLYDGQKIRGALRRTYEPMVGLDHDSLREHTRRAYWDSTQARALLNRIADNTIGTGLELEAAPAWEIIKSNMTPAERRAWSREVELRFWLWANTTEADEQGMRALPELQAFAFINELRDGEVLAILRYDGNLSRLSPISMQFIAPEQIGPLTLGATNEAAIVARGNVYHEGFETTKTGRPVAVWLQDPGSREVTRVPFFGPTGRRFVIHSAVTDLPGQIRGVSPLAPVIHEIKKLTDYQLAEIEAAVINAVFAAYIKPSAENDTRTNLAAAVGGGARLRSSEGAADTTARTGTEIRLDRPGMILSTLKAGEDLASFDTKRPNVNFGEFVKAVLRSISAALSIPVEVLEMSFNANYSASRAALIQFWMTIDKWRAHFAAQFLQPLYESWFAEEAKAGRINAPGFNGPLPIIRRAWLATDWIGQSMPSIDPLKDANADNVRIEQGATTRERVAQKYNGSDFYDNAERQAREREAMPTPAPEAPREPAQPPREREEETEE